MRLTNFKQYDAVRILEIRNPNEFHADEMNTREPCVGDVATILEVYSEPSLGFELECCDPNGVTLWLQAFGPDDLEVEAAPEAGSPITISGTVATPHALSVMTDELLKHPTELASALIARMAGTGASLDFSEKSVEILDDWIEEDRRDASLSEESKFTRSQFYGAYLGECIRKRSGGEWQFFEDPEEWRLVFPNNLGSAGPMGMILSPKC